MNRRELDAFVAHHKLSSTAVDAVLEIAGARPVVSEIRHFAMRLLQLAGVLSIAAGLVFFVAANWQEIGIAGRFALVQSVVVVSVAIALWKAPPQAVGRYALLMAFIAAGALLALFGQTYQTGADVYELFLTWTLVGLPFVVASQWPVAWAAWLVVLNQALLLFFWSRPQGGWLWVLFGPWSSSEALVLLAPCAVNLALWAGTEYLDGARYGTFAPRWVRRLILAFAFYFLTWTGIEAIDSQALAGQDVLSLLLVIALEAAVVIYSARRRNDVFPPALAAGSCIIISTVGLAVQLDLDELRVFFLLAVWLVVTSTISGRILMNLVRAWRQAEEAV